MPIQTSLAFSVAPGPQDAALAAVPYGPDLPPAADLPVPAGELLGHYEAKGEPGEIVEVPVARGDGVGRVLLYGIGDGTAAALRKAGAALARRARGREELTVTLPAADPAGWAALAEGALLGGYAFLPERIRPVGELRLVGPPEAEAAVRRGEIFARAVGFTRDLANTPSSVKTPQWLAEQAVAVAQEAGLTVRVWEPAELAAEGFGGILAVGRGSASPPRLVRLGYEPPGATRHVVLVGKGITFDSGGLSLKPNDNMKLMKTDMAGAAVVIAVLRALRELAVPVRVTGLIAAAENMPSGTAQRPGDVVTQYGGRTVEVLNTDAEGRLVLADALAYADAELAPDVLVDIATLTGAIGIALGKEHAGLFASDDVLAKELLEAGEASGDRVWRMPLIDEYRPGIDSEVADLANVEVGTEFGAGSIAAALFLREFTGGRPWAHLDIAGVGRSTVDEGVLTKGATGFGTRLLLAWLTR